MPNVSCYIPTNQNNLTDLGLAPGEKLDVLTVCWRNAGALTWDLFRMGAQCVHEVTHGIQFPPETAELRELWVAQKELLGIRV